MLRFWCKDTIRPREGRMFATRHRCRNSQKGADGRLASSDGEHNTWPWPSTIPGPAQYLAQDMHVVERIAAAMDVAGAFIILGWQCRFSASGTLRLIIIINRSPSASTG